MKRYKKSIFLRYEYIDSPEGKEAMAEVFDDIFKRIIQKQSNRILVNENKILTIP